MNNIIKEGELFDGQIEFSTSGHASINVNEKSIFIHKKNTLNSLHLDKVKVEIYFFHNFYFTNYYYTNFISSKYIFLLSLFIFSF